MPTARLFLPKQLKIGIPSGLKSFPKQRFQTPSKASYIRDDVDAFLDIMICNSTGNVTCFDLMPRKVLLINVF